MNQLIAVCAVIGAALGLINFLRTYLDEAERVTLGLWQGDGEHPCVEVVNHSNFAVTIVEIGRLMGDGRVASIALDQRFEDKVPARIPARDARSFRIAVRELLADNVHGVRYCYARTALGSVFTNEPKLVGMYRRLLEACNLQPRDLR